MGRLWSFFSGSDPAPPSTSSPNPAPTVTTKPPEKKKPHLVKRIGRWILAFFFGSDPADNRINIEVKHLAAIWLQYNKYPETKAGDNRVTAPESSLQTGPAGLLVQASQKSPVNSLVQEFIEPYEQMYKNQNALEGAIKMADYLEQYGNCPSVAEHLAGTDNEMQEIQTVKEHLLKITLKDHSLRVARNLLQLLKKTYQNADLLIPKAVVTALGHDLGKILVLKKG